MRAEINQAGRLDIIAETGIEGYAITKWWDSNRGKIIAEGAHIGYDSTPHEQIRPATVEEIQAAAAAATQAKGGCGCGCKDKKKPTNIGGQE